MTIYASFLLAVITTSFLFTLANPDAESIEKHSSAISLALFLPVFGRVLGWW